MPVEVLGFDSNPLAGDDFIVVDSENTARKISEYRSNKNLQKKVVQYTEINSIEKNTCVYGDLYTKEFLLKKDFTCFENYSEVDAAKIRPFFAYKNVKNVKRSDPKDCKLIWNETYKYSFYNKDISVGTLWFCN